MYRYTLPLLLFLLVCALASAASAQVIDNFDNGDISAWNVKAPYYVTLSVTSPGAGGAGKALAITETPSTAHSQNALAHRVFASSQDWSAYKTLQLDAQISSGQWNGYSISIYNAGNPVLTRGLHADASKSGFQSLSIDISSMPRNQVTEIVIYVNLTSQNAGQTLTIDNLKLSSTQASISDPLTLQDFESAGDINYWTSPLSPTYDTSTSVVSDGTNVLQAVENTVDTSGHSPNALFRWRPAQTMDWYDYNTLQFDARITTSTTTDGFSIRLYNRGAGVKIKKFVPGTSSFATCQIDISDMARDQINEVLFYVNRMGANAGQTLHIDNIKLLKATIPPTPDVLTLDNFDSYSAGPLNSPYTTPWNNFYLTSGSINGSDSSSSPNSLDIILSSGSGVLSYTRRSWNTTIDLGDYKSLSFEAKMVKGITGNVMPWPVGQLIDLVNGSTTGPTIGSINDIVAIANPSAYSNDWQTVTVDITGGDLDQVKWLRFYDNRSAVYDTGQITRIDNLRVSKAPAPVPSVGNVDDFEHITVTDPVWKNNATDWYYQHSVTDSIQTDPVTGNHYFSIANGGIATDTGVWENDNTFAYTRKTMHQKWSGYTTLQFDARTRNSNTNQGFELAIRDIGTGSAVYYYHSFTPTPDWKTYKIDISGDTRSEIIGLLFYPNFAYVDIGSNSIVSQNGAQELDIDNIKLTNDTIPITLTKVGDVKKQDEGTIVILDGKIVTGYFEQAAHDVITYGDRDVIMIEEADRSSAMPVMIAPGSTLTNPMNGDKIKVTGPIVNSGGTRYIYATKIDIEESYLPTPAPVALKNRDCGAASKGLYAGVPGFTGLDTTGMYAVVTGKVLRVEQSGSLNRYCYYIDDGSGVAADNGKVGLKVYDMFYPSYIDTSLPWVGSYVRAYGFVMNEYDATTGTSVRSLWLNYLDPYAINAIASP